jgi:hypothetical protein
MKEMRRRAQPRRSRACHQKIGEDPCSGILEQMHDAGRQLVHGYRQNIHIMGRTRGRLGAAMPGGREVLEDQGQIFLWRETWFSATAVVKDAIDFLA